MVAAKKEYVTKNLTAPKDLVEFLTSKEVKYYILSGKKFVTTPTITIATRICRSGSEADERRVANYMSHYVDTARSAYQHLTDGKRAADVYKTLQVVVNTGELPVQCEF